MGYADKRVVCPFCGEVVFPEFNNKKAFDGDSKMRWRWDNHECENDEVRRSVDIWLGYITKELHSSLKDAFIDIKEAGYKPKREFDPEKAYWKFLEVLKKHGLIDPVEVGKLIEKHNSKK